MQRLYLETSVISYLTARPSTDLVESAGFSMPFVCTPEELMGDTDVY